MATKRTPISRHRKPAITEEMIELFARGLAALAGPLITCTHTCTALLTFTGAGGAKANATSRAGALLDARMRKHSRRSSRAWWLNSFIKIVFVLRLGKPSIDLPMFLHVSRLPGLSIFWTIPL